MKLNVLERLTLMGILPQSENYATFKIVADLKTQLSFSEKEIKDFGVEFKGDQVSWNPLKIKEKDIEIGEALRGIIVVVLQKLDSDKKIDEKNISLYEKFVLSVK